MDYLNIICTYAIYNYKYTFQNDETLTFSNASVDTNNVISYYIDDAFGDDLKIKSIKLMHNIITKRIQPYIDKIDSVLINLDNFMIYYIVNNKHKAIHKLYELYTIEQIPKHILKIN